MGKFVKGGGSLRAMLHAILVWSLAAMALLALAALILAKAETGSEVLGYVSSAISFLCAVAAGADMSGKQGDKFLLPCILTAGILVILLLTVGFLAQGREMNPSGILSVVTFTVAGVMFGGFFFRKRKKKPGKRRFGGMNPPKRRFP